MNAEQARLAEDRAQTAAWKRWGPYLSERQWGTVREDYSDSGNAWDYFSHDQARSRAYRWGEDGLAGFSDEKQRLCFALALWNEHDPILKERLFGLTNSEGNHGEDVKEYYFYLDSTPTHAYAKYLYKYPQAAFPYDDLVRTNRQRSRHELEYELVDTGVFADNRYFDVFVEYAKAAPEDLLITITVCNRGPEAAPIHLLPTLWFRNTWSWRGAGAKPVLARLPGRRGVVKADHPELGTRYFSCDGDPALLFTENESNNARLFGTPNRSPYVKDAFHTAIVEGVMAAVNPQGAGTKAAAHYALVVPAGGEQTIRLRLSDAEPSGRAVFGGGFDRVCANRRREADEFYASITPEGLSDDERLVMRQALAGMLWSKQYYYFDLDTWLEEHDAHPFHGQRRASRNQAWFHMVNDDVISMPDKWEYPWYAAWDLAFHTVPLAMVDVDFAKDQLGLMLSGRYLHPNGQIPAYEWNFGDVNPPVHAWATLFVYQIDKQRRGEGDIEFLKRSFEKLLLNFTWWVNRKDPGGRNVFEGGFLGLDNIGVFDRSAPLPTGGHLEQADGTAWMAFFSQGMLQIALELAAHDPGYEDMALKFVEHFFWIASAMDRVGDNHDEMWDEKDGFFYDVLRLPGGKGGRLKVRSLVGVLPLCAVAVVESSLVDRFPRFLARARDFLARQPELLATVPAPAATGVNGRRLLAPLTEDKLRRVLARVLDEDEFLGPYGIRSLSRAHLDNPYVLHAGGQDYRVAYEPAESTTGMFGGNSNWRGPVWMPINLLVIRALLSLHTYYGESFTVECPARSGRQMNLFQVAEEIGRRLSATFLRGADGTRPVYGGASLFQEDPHWKDLVLFYEYFHGDNGAGLGASHQTGWTGIVARLIQGFAQVSSDSLVRDGQKAVLAPPPHA